MSFTVALRHAGDVAVIDVTGRLALGEHSGELRDCVKELVRKGEKKLLLNLKEVSYIDSAGLGEVVCAYASMTNAGGQIKLLHTQPKIHDLLYQTKLHTIFIDYSDETTATRSFDHQEPAKR